MANMKQSTMRSVIRGRSLAGLLLIFSLTCCSDAQKIPATALPVDLMAFDPPSIQATGFRSVERAAGQDFRWVLGPRAVLKLYLDAPMRLVLAFKASNPIEGQDMAVILNGLRVREFTNIPKTDRLTGFKNYEVLLDVQPGPVEIALEFAQYNHKSPDDTFAPEDKDPLAMTISGLEITQPDHEPRDCPR
jgi:hypothetical protein